MPQLQTKDRERIFAEEALVVDAQLFLHKLMEEKGISKAQLAREMGVSKARISQLFSDDCENLTIRLFARAAHALGERIELDCHHFRCVRAEKAEEISRSGGTKNVVRLWHHQPTQIERADKQRGEAKLNALISHSTLQREMA